MARKDAILRLHEQLVAKRDSLRSKATTDRKLNRTTSRGGDVGDAALRAEHAEMNNQIAAFESRELAMVEKAILLIKSGRYGKCEVCEKSIPIQRAKGIALHAVLCLLSDGIGGVWELARGAFGRLGNSLRI